MIKHALNFDFYESETAPPLEGPKIWFRPSDGAHFGRGEDGWVRYNPVNADGYLCVGETMKVEV